MREASGRGRIFACSVSDNSFAERTHGMKICFQICRDVESQNKKKNCEHKDLETT